MVQYEGLRDAGGKRRGWIWYLVSKIKLVRERKTQWMLEMKGKEI